ncbi:MAG: nucleotide exchange factor GrpE [Alphaproteobacteria bacterium]|nr:nucleotide exchange factor GrpE [Alphaproteobacteria bacterium]
MTEKKTSKPANDRAANDQNPADPAEAPAPDAAGDPVSEADLAVGEPSHTALEASEASEAGETAETPEERVDPMAQLEADLADFRDKHLRALAEIENVRRRGEKEKADALKYAATNFAKDILGVADNLRRAIEAVPEDAAEADGPVKTLIEGVELTEKELLSIFERHGIKPIAADGQKFDHNLHQAMMEVPDTGKPAGTVVQVLQGGYTIHDRLLRPAMVGVAKGGAKDGDKDADKNGGGEPEGGKGSKVDTNA